MASTVRTGLTVACSSGPVRGTTDIGAEAGAAEVGVDVVIMAAADMVMVAATATAVVSPVEDTAAEAGAEAVSTAGTGFAAMAASMVEEDFTVVEASMAAEGFMVVAVSMVAEATVVEDTAEVIANCKPRKPALSESKGDKNTAHSVSCGFVFGGEAWPRSGERNSEFCPYFL